MAVEEHRRLVVIGSSAGGIDALTELVTTLPAELKAPIVVAQHLDPRRPSHLAEILEHRSPLPIKSVGDEEKMQEGVIYVVPADRDVAILDGVVRVFDQGTGRSKPSVDRLFASAAEAYGENLVAVVLTGAGSDGAEGARRVKLQGGIVVIQDPATARFPSMPQSLAPTTVDVVAPLATIGQILADLVAADRPILDDDQLLTRFLAQVRDQTGIDFAQYKRPTILRRLHRRMAAVRAETFKDYMRFAGRNPDEYAKLASTFLIKVTDFFRDPELYEKLRSEVIPRLVAESMARSRELRIWSAGCATGEEAYSLAIVVAEALGGEDLSRYGVRIFATDLDNDAISFARRGIYPRSAIGDMPEEMVGRYFVPVGEDFEIRKQIRAMTVFGQHDLAQRAPFPRIDLCVSRNVLIYFTPELQRRALQLFAFSVRDDGYLVLGKAETVTPLADYFAVEDQRLKIYRRHGERALIPPTPRMTSADDLASLVSARTRRRSEPSQTGAGREQRPGAVDRADQILAKMPLGVVLVAPDYDIQLINGLARQLLGVHGTAVGQDFVHVARDIPSPVLRDGIDRARAGQDSETSVELEGPGSGGARALTLHFVQHRVEVEQDRVDGVVVFVTDGSASQRRTREHEVELEQLREAAGHMARQTAGLENANRELLKVNLELTSAHAEMRSANEELLVGSEEVQAATEEVETLNEELQATNEELETLNEELQATVEELNTTNDDLEARGVELADALASLQDQRRLTESDHSRLTRFLLDSDLGLLVVDALGGVVLRNETWRRLVDQNDGAAFVREPDSAPVKLSDVVLELTEAASDGRSFVVWLRTAGSRGGERRYELRGESLKDDTGQVRGGLLMLNPRGGSRS